jgi:hypothetical protein
MKVILYGIVILVLIYVFADFMCFRIQRKSLWLFIGKYVGKVFDAFFM